MTQPVFTKAFTQQEPIPESGIARAVELMRQGRLHRYNLDKNDPNDTSQLEEAFAAWQGADYCLACTSGGYAIQLALRVCGVKQGDRCWPMPIRWHRYRAPSMPLAGSLFWSILTTITISTSMILKQGCQQSGQVSAFVAYAPPYCRYGSGDRDLPKV